MWYSIQGSETANVPSVNPYVVVTSAFDALLVGPHADVSLRDVSFEERVHVRKITPNASSDTHTDGRSGRLISVAYLVGDERAAAQRFVEANRGAPDHLDPDAGRNVKVPNVDRPIYDWILHEHGH